MNSDSQCRLVTGFESPKGVGELGAKCGRRLDFLATPQGSPRFKGGLGLGGAAVQIQDEVGWAEVLNPGRQALHGLVTGFGAVPVRIPRDIQNGDSLLA